MNNKMPSMPSIPSISTPISGEAPVSQVPFTEESEVNSSDSDVGLDIPSHDEDPIAHLTPQINTALQAPSNELKMPQARAQRGIPVVATRKGFYNQMRFKEGDEFLIRSEQDFGEWMMCVDPALEKKRKAYFEQKRKNQKKA